jgi:hypothetical protein
MPPDRLQKIIERVKELGFETNAAQIEKSAKLAAELSFGRTDEELSHAVSRKEMVSMLAGLMSAIIDNNKILRDRIDGLTERLSEVESCGIKYFGVYQRAITYPRGAVTTHSGSAWVALRDTAGEVPGDEGGRAWHLMVKRGRDGHDPKSLPS